MKNEGVRADTTESERVTYVTPEHPQTPESEHLSSALASVPVLHFRERTRGATNAFIVSDSNVEDTRLHFPTKFAKAVAEVHRSE